MKEDSSPVGGSERRGARRFPIKTPLYYRVWNKADWSYGTTENISTSGILFRCEELAERGTRVEIGFVLPSALEQGRGAKVVCTGEVVRLETLKGTEVPPGLAVKIMNCELFPWSAVGGESSGPEGGHENEG